MKYVFQIILFLLWQNVSSQNSSYLINGLFYKPIMEVAVTEGQNNYSGDITIPQTVEIGNEFYTVTRIEDYAFRGCKGVTSIKIPISVVKLGAYSMAGCAFKEIYISQRVKEIGLYAFSTETLENIMVDNNNDYFTSLEGVLYNKGKTILYQYPQAKNEVVYVMEEGVKSFMPGSLFKLELEYLDLPSTLEWFGEYNLLNTPNLKVLIVRAVEAPWVNNSFNHTLCENCILYVPDESVDIYKSHERWGEFKKILPLGSLSSKESIKSTKSTYKQIYDISGRVRTYVSKGLNIVKGSEGVSKIYIK